MYGCFSQVYNYNKSIISCIIILSYCNLYDYKFYDHILFGWQYERPISSGAISFDKGDPKIYPVTLPLPKLAEAMQTTGEAKYVDDYDYVNALHAVLVMSSQGNAAIADVDATSALRLPGVTAFISAKSLAEKGYCNQVSEQEELYISKRASYCGQAIGMVVAETKVRGGGGGWVFFWQKWMAGMESGSGRGRCE